MQSFVGPVAAFFTFIGSMGNIPLDYTFVLNIGFLLLSGVCVVWIAVHGGFAGVSSSLGEWALRALAVLCFVWLAAGALVPLFADAPQARASVEAR